MTDQTSEPSPCSDTPCREAAAELYTYLDGVLTDDKRAAIARHLDDCPPCGDAFTFESELRTVIAQRCREEVPADLRARIAAAIRDCDESPAGAD